MASLLNCAKRLACDRRGGIALVVGLSAPVLMMFVGAAVEYAHIALRVTQLQKAADTSVLTAVQQLRLSNTADSVVVSVAQAAFDNAAPADGVSRTVTPTISNNRSTVQVNATEDVKSVMGKILTLPSSQITVVAAAQIMGQTKLCLLTLDPSKGKAMQLEDGSSITATGCGLFSNSTDKKGFSAGKSAQATASVICSAGGVENKGAYLTPTPTTDCPTVSDPLAKVPRPSVGYCSGSETPLDASTTRTLYPGTYCNGITVSGNAQVTFMPGIYVINNGPFIVQNNASISGNNVGFYFTGNAAGLRFDPTTSINLTAPRDGVMAGLLLFEDRSVNNPVPPPPGPKGAPPAPPYGSVPMREYRITSNNAPNLLGTIYLPAGRLIVTRTRRWRASPPTR